MVTVRLLPQKVGVVLILVKPKVATFDEGTEIL